MKISYKSLQGRCVAPHAAIGMHKMSTVFRSSLVSFLLKARRTPWEFIQDRLTLA